MEDTTFTGPGHQVMLQDSMYKKKIVLASSSLRRKDILERAGIEFSIDVSDYEEDLSLRMSARKLARHLSFEKAKAVASRHRNAIIIAADTIICLNDKIYGKPHNESDAKRILKILNGRVHKVITGFTIVDTGEGRFLSRSVITKVYFNRMTMNEIDEYVRTGEPLDKAGAYAIQGKGVCFVKKIEGDYNNVVGLPMNVLMKTLRRFGIKK